MNTLRIWTTLAWIGLPTVMYGGYALLRIINRGDVLSPFQVSTFRAGHAHAGVLLLMALLFSLFVEHDRSFHRYEACRVRDFCRGNCCAVGRFFYRDGSRQAKQGVLPHHDSGRHHAGRRDSDTCLRVGHVTIEAI